jgi:hypothetical protein
VVLLYSAWSIYLIKDDICVRGAGAALAGMDGMFLLVFSSVPCFFYARRRGFSYVRSIRVGETVSPLGQVLPATVLLSLISAVMNFSVILDQSRFLCPSYYF